MPYDGVLHRSRDELLASVRERVRQATDEVVVSVPANVYRAIRGDLSAAVDRDVFVLLLVHSDEESGRGDRFEGAATVARRESNSRQLFCIADKEYGIDGHRLFVDPVDDELDDEYRGASTIHNPVFAQALYGYFLADAWSVAEEVYAIPQPSLPKTYDNFRRAVVEATLFLRDGFVVECRGRVRSIDDREERRVSGTVVNARQSVVHPVSSSFPTEHSLVCRFEGERATVGGLGSFIEDYEAIEFTLESAG
ncbi:MAG: TrmB family transcriptional regulator sugar-binding domain-containing protein [Haloarculaceae archaeon]